MYSQADSTMKPMHIFPIIITEYTPTVCVHSCDTMPHSCIPAGSRLLASGPDFQKASKSISPSPRLSFPSRLSCLGMHSGERSDPGMETCDGSGMGMLVVIPPGSGPVPPEKAEVKLLRLLWSGDTSSVLVLALRKLRIGSSDLMVICRFGKYPF